MIRQTRNVLMEELLDEGKFNFKGFVQNEVSLTPVVCFKMIAKYYLLPFYEANKITGDEEAKEFLEEKEYMGWLKSVVQKLGFVWYDHWEMMEPVMKYCYKWAGVPHNSSIAASAAILTDNIPNLPIRDEAIGGDSHAVADNGYIKYDLLSIDTLNQIQPFYGLDVDWNNVYDPVVWKTIYTGDTDFVFQFGSGGMKRLLKDAHVDSIDKLADCNGIFRPGALALGTDQKYIDSYNGTLELSEEDTSLLLAMKDIYGEDHSGMIIFQEEVMSLCTSCGFTGMESDDIRRALGKKIEWLLQSYREKFIAGYKYTEYFDLGPAGKFLPYELVTLVDGSKLKASEAYERIQNGEELDIEPRSVDNMIHENMI